MQTTVTSFSIWHNKCFIVLNAPGALQGRFDGCTGKKGDFPCQPPQRAREPPQNG